MDWLPNGETLKNVGAAIGYILIGLWLSIKAYQAKPKGEVPKEDPDKAIRNAIGIGWSHERETERFFHCLESIAGSLKRLADEKQNEMGDDLKEMRKLMERMDQAERRQRPRSRGTE